VMLSATALAMSSSLAWGWLPSKKRLSRGRIQNGLTASPNADGATAAKAGKSRDA
jgi:hypothetical protein